MRRPVPFPFNKFVRGRVKTSLRRKPLSFSAWVGVQFHPEEPIQRRHHGFNSQEMFVSVSKSSGTNMPLESK